MKKLCKIVLVLFVMMAGSSFAALAEEEADSTPSRVLNVVYDDSGSMLINGDTWVDTWCQAKYAMEVFAALLEEKDTLNIFPMSTNSSSGRNPDMITVSGKDPVSQRVSRIHDMQTEQALGTPYNAVSQAVEHLKRQNADQKWLIVLTDGQFDEDGTKPADLNRTFRGYTADGMKIVFLTIGQNTDRVDTDPEHGIFAENAASSAEVIDRVTTISNQIFERNALSGIDAQNGTFSFDVPMSQLIVFAQGDAVQINGISGGSALRKESEVNVQYSDLIPKNYEDEREHIVVAKELKGTVTVFAPKDGEEIEPGDYQLDVQGAQRVEIYYKPNVDVGIRIFQGTQDVTDHDALEAGTYTIRVGFLDDESGEFIESPLLGEIDADATITNNGKEVEVSNDNEFTVDIGEADIAVEATYLKYNRTSISQKYNVLAKVIPLEMTLDHADAYGLQTLPQSQMTLRITHEGKPLSQAQWDAMPLPEIYCAQDVEFEVRKGKEVSTFEITMKYQDGERARTYVGDLDLKIRAEADMVDYTAEGTLDSQLTITDDRSLLDRTIDFLKEYWMWMIGIWVIFCMLMKFRGPTGLGKKKLSPNVEMTKYEDKTLSSRDPKRYAAPREVKIEPLSVLPILPITVRRRITIRHPKCSQSAPSLRVKSSGRGLILLNPKDFDNKKNKNLCEGLERLSRRKELQLGQQIMYSCKTTKNRGSGLASTKSSFIFRFKRNKS